MRQQSTSRIDYGYIKRTISLSMILARYGILESLRPSGSELKGCCPIHHGTNKRQFSVNLRENTWHCFGDCREGGGTLEFVAAIEHIGIHEAAVRIAEWFALSLPHSSLATKERRLRMSGSNRPSHKVYAVEETRDRDDAEVDHHNDDEKPFWTRLGSAWPHKDGKGLNVVLSGLPLNGRLVLREYTEKDAKADEDKRKAASNKKR